MMRRWRIWVGVGAVLALLLAFGAPAAFGATYAWEFETATYDYGPQLVGGAPTEHSFVLTNTGETKIERILWGIRWYLGPEAVQPLDDHLFRLETEPPCRTLEPGESCTMTVAFAPERAGAKYGELQVYTGKEGPPGSGVELRGRGASPEVAVTPESLDLGSVEVGKGSSPQTVEVENQGDFGLDFRGIAVTDLLGMPESAGPFRIVGGTCRVGELVAPESACTVQITFTPTEAGVVGAKLALSDDAPGSPQPIELGGTGTAPPPAMTTSQPGTVNTGPPATPPPPAAKAKRHRPLVCPKGRRKSVKKGKRVCVKVRERSRHHPSAPRR